MITDLKINEDRKKLYYEKGYWSEKTLGDIWLEQATRCADREYVKDDKGSKYTYGEVDDKASRLAAWFIDQGIQPGDVITFQMPTWAEFCIIYVAVLKVGGVIHPLPRKYNDADLLYGMNLVGSKAFICPTKVAKIDFEDQILSIMNDIPSLTSVALVDRMSPKHSDLPTLEEIYRTYEPYTERPVITSDDVACILSTSGTTGKPKAVLFTHNNLIFSERVFTQGLKRTQEDVMFMPSPLNHATGFYHGLISPMLMGGRTVLQQDFRPAEAIELMNAEGCTWSMGATPFIYDMLKCIEQGGPHFETLELFVCGGAPVPGTLVQRAHNQDVRLCEVYGSTESCPHIFVPPEHCLEWNGDFSGIPFPGIEVRIVGPDRADLPLGEQGEEASRGPHQFVGYLNEPERTARALDDEGWFYSGDLGFMDEQGRIRINGRKKEIIIRGGENICASEIDEDLIGCPGLEETATIGMPDERLGERICTFAVPTDERRPTVADVTAYLAEKHVAKRLWPERMEYIDVIPKTATGKIRRHELSEELARRMAQE